MPTPEGHLTPDEAEDAWVSSIAAAVESVTGQLLHGDRDKDPAAARTVLLVAALDRLTAEVAGVCEELRQAREPRTVYMSREEYVRQHTEAWMRERPHECMFCRQVAALTEQGLCSNCSERYLGTKPHLGTLDVGSADEAEPEETVQCLWCLRVMPVGSVRFDQHGRCSHCSPRTLSPDAQARLDALPAGAEFGEGLPGKPNHGLCDTCGPFVSGLEFPDGSFLCACRPKERRPSHDH